MAVELSLCLGGNVLVALYLFVYFMITWSIIRFFQVLYKLDHRMRVITSTYFEEQANRTV